MSTGSLAARVLHRWQTDQTSCSDEQHAATGSANTIEGAVRTGEVVDLQGALD